MPPGTSCNGFCLVLKALEFPAGQLPHRRLRAWIEDRAFGSECLPVFFAFVKPFAKSHIRRCFAWQKHQGMNEIDRQLFINHRV